MGADLGDAQASIGQGGMAVQIALEEAAGQLEGVEHIWSINNKVKYYLS